MAGECEPEEICGVAPCGAIRDGKEDLNGGGLFWYV